MNRVVVTGMGAITPVGNDVDTFWNSLKQGTVGIGPITSFDTADYKVKLAAEVKDFDPKQYMDPKAARRMERFSQLAVAASKQALEDAGIDMEKEDPYRVGVCVSSGIGSLQAIEREYQKLLEKGPGRINPLLVPLMISNMAAGNVSIQFGLKGKSLNVVTACATGPTPSERPCGPSSTERQRSWWPGARKAPLLPLVWPASQPDGSFHSGGSSAGLHSL